MNTMWKTFGLAALLFAATAQAVGVSFGGASWQVDAREFEMVDYLGARAMRIRGGYATLIGFEQQDGLIEFDMAVSADRGFAGAIFRVQDLANFEHFYLRPHMSGNVDANQYTPVFNGVSAWQLYHGEGYGAPVTYRYDAWMHVRIAYRGDQAEVYIDSEQPVLRVNRLRRPVAAGGVGFGAGNFAPAHFAHFRASPLPADYRFIPAASPPAPPAPGTVLHWRVSESFAKDELPLQLETEHEWSVVPAENSGVTNLAGAPGMRPGTNTVFARLVLESDAAQLKELAFGYSDSVIVYLNGVPLYQGDNTYRSRDYRYLGTIGLFDTVYLPLTAGRNEIWFAVTEAFGGWGIQARFPSLEGIRQRQDP